MNPFFYQILVIVILAGAATASKGKGGYFFLAALVASFLLFIGSAGGFSSKDAFAMVVGWGILVMIPIFFACLLAVLIGEWIFDRRMKKERESKLCDDDT